MLVDVVAAIVRLLDKEVVAWIGRALGCSLLWRVLQPFPRCLCLPLPISHLAVAASIVGVLLPAPRVPKEVLCKGTLLPSW